MGKWDKITRQLPKPGQTGDQRAVAVAKVQERIERAGILGSGMVVIALDRSTSMAHEDRLAEAKRGVVEFARAAVGYRVGLVAFGDNADELVQPGTDVNLIVNALTRIDAMGSTDMLGALKVAGQRLSGQSGVRIVVIMTDGEPNDMTATLLYGEELKASGVEIKVVPTTGANMAFLDRLRSSGDTARIVPPQQLAAAMKAVALALPPVRGNDR